MFYIYKSIKKTVSFVLSGRLIVLFLLDNHVYIVQTEKVLCCICISSGLCFHYALDVSSLSSSVKRHWNKQQSFWIGNSFESCTGLLLLLLLFTIVSTIVQLRAATRWYFRRGARLLHCSWLFYL